MRRSILNFLFLPPFPSTGRWVTHICFSICSNHYATLSFSTASKKITLAIQQPCLNDSQKQTVVSPGGVPTYLGKPCPAGVLVIRQVVHILRVSYPDFNITANWQPLRVMAQGYKDMSLFPQGWLSAFISFLFILVWSDFQRLILVFPLIIIKVKFYLLGWICDM